MSAQNPIPDFDLFGETGGFPDVVHCEAIRDRAPRYGWSIAPHRHNGMAQIFVVETGGARVLVDREQREMTQGQALFVPAQAVHGFEFQDGTAGLVLSFPLPLLQAVTQGQGDLARQLAHPFLAEPGAALSGLIAALAARFAEAGTYRAPMLVALAQAVLVGMAERGGAGEGRRATAAERQVARFDALIAAHMAEGWKLSDYASALSVTPGHLGRLCREVAGRGAGAHLDAAVMSEACRLLAFTQLPVAEIGFRLGYQDPPYFSRRFRAVTGETPTAYRARFVS
ncbi:helix-turn-helix domain-containing protein [Poseidonocella sp. HB161398]|uniref:helix-turn-helix domain-containing protein n=1 Tax=Poseidonocella sp. HB161398 TaxID=2320855 RepID=UPI00110909AD|nr:helix-turn-helix domain-containing protein [Poseidonocella sp. HB161398]